MDDCISQLQFSFSVCLALVQNTLMNILNKELFGEKKGRKKKWNEIPTPKTKHDLFRIIIHFRSRSYQKLQPFVTNLSAKQKWTLKKFSFFVVIGDLLVIFYRLELYSTNRQYNSSYYFFHLFKNFNIGISNEKKSFYFLFKQKSCHVDEHEIVKFCWTKSFDDDDVQAFQCVYLSNLIIFHNWQTSFFPFSSNIAFNYISNNKSINVFSSAFNKIKLKPNIRNKWQQTEKKNSKKKNCRLKSCSILIQFPSLDNWTCFFCCCILSICFYFLNKTKRT